MPYFSFVGGACSCPAWGWYKGRSLLLQVVIDEIGKVSKQAINTNLGNKYFQQLGETVYALR